ncbi:MAG TPA: type VI secretion system tube protein Hcp [Dehalococcoidia bacterium]
MHRQRLHRYRRPQPGGDEQRQEAADGLNLATARRDATMLGAEGILRLQRSIGNQAVQRLVIQRQPNEAVEADTSKARNVPRMVATITLKSGKVEGSVREPGHEGKIAIESINFDVGRRDSGVGRGREGSPPVQITITKRKDDSSTALIRAVVNGEHMESAQFEALSLSDDGTVSARVLLDLKDGYFSSYSLGDELESFTMEFGAQQQDSGSDRPEE